MTETAYTRSRRASLYGLLLQAVVFAGLLVLSTAARSSSVLVLAWYAAGGLLLWLPVVLVFRQRELAALEALDLEELRREKQATGAGEAIFEQDGAGLRVAEARLRWMLRWLVPAFGLIEAAYLGGMGLYAWSSLKPLGETWDELVNVPLAMIILALVMVLFFLYSRYCSGMGRVPEWQLLRACGSYMLGNALGVLAAIACLGVALYADVAAAEHVLAYVLCAVMMVLAFETVVSFVLDIYRPRAPEVEPRACFDSRLLALLAEPGGIASTIAEAINYQFGFEVSQTWFYRLLQRTLVPLLAAGVAILWLLTCVLVVQPGERAIIERFGRQVNADEPYEPGFYWKLPWPIDVARKYETERLHQIVIGFKQFDAEAVPSEEGEGVVGLWTDERHFGQPHFDFLIPVPPVQEGEERVRTAAAEATEGRAAQAWPVNMVRMDVAVQYRIRADRLGEYTRRCLDPHRALLNIAWKEVTRYVASWDIFSLLGEKYGTAGEEIKERLNRRLEGLGLGLEVIYVGVQNVHPEAGVAKEFRKVISAEQEKIAAIREALVKENEILSAVAGDREKARALAEAIAGLGPAETALYRTQLTLLAADSQPVESFKRKLDELRPAFERVVEAQWRLSVAQEQKEEVELDAEVGLGRSDEEKLAAAEAVRRAEENLSAARAELEAACAPIEQAATAQLGAAVSAALREHAEAEVALKFWNGRLEELLPQVQGEAAATLAKAQAERWALELGAATELSRIRGEREAYRAAPRVYKVRKYLETMVEGIKGSRKFFLAFDPGERQVRVRFIAEEQARPDDASFPTRLNP